MPLYFLQRYNVPTYEEKVPQEGCNRGYCGLVVNIGWGMLGLLGIFLSRGVII